MLWLPAPNSAAPWATAMPSPRLLPPPWQATPTSPIRVKVEPSHDASKVKAEGPGLGRTGEHGQPLVGQSGGHEEARGEAPLHGHHVASGVELGKPTHFTVNAKAAGKGKLDVQFSGLAKGDAVRDVDIIDHHDNTYAVKYTPVQQVLPVLPRRWAGRSGGLPAYSRFPPGTEPARNGRLGAGERSPCFSHPSPSLPKWGRHGPGRPRS